MYPTFDDDHFKYTAMDGEGVVFFSLGVVANVLSDMNVDEPGRFDDQMALEYGSSSDEDNDQEVVLIEEKGAYQCSLS